MADFSPSRHKTGHEEHKSSPTVNIPVGGSATKLNRGSLMSQLSIEMASKAMDTDVADSLRTSFQPVRDQQHEMVYNKFLPYSGQLESEASQWLADIKENLAKCVLAVDYRPGVFFWTTRLDSYIALYGRQFSKQDHVYFIKLYMELLLDPNMDPSLVGRWCKISSVLLKKLELISAEDLTMDWRPLWKLYEKINPSKDQFHGVMYWPDKLEDDLRELIGYCRYYFPLSATQELLDEFRPMFCPFDESMSRAMNALAMFLPTMLKATDKKFGYQLWLEELLRIWLGFHGVPSWESYMLQLFSRVAAENIGFIQWDDYISAIFTKFLRTLELPVGKKQLQLVYSNESFDESSAVLWPVAMMHSEACLLALERLFKSVESYFHPSNYGNWTDKLSSTLMFLPVGLVARLQLERFRPQDWMPEIPKEACLTDDNIRRFVKAFKPLAFLNLFGKSASDEAVEAIKNLALLAPDEIFPDLLEKFYASVETLTEPERFQSIVSALCGALPYLFHYKDGKKNVVPLMLAMLPGIDSNDAKKTTSTLGFFSTICAMVPLRPCYSSADADDSTISESDREVCGQSAEFEDILLQLLDRCLTLIDAFTVDPNSRSDRQKAVTAGGDMNMDEKIIKIRMDMLWLTIFTQADDKIAELLMERLFSAASTRIYPVQQLGAIATSAMCALAMRIRPTVAKPILLHRLLRILETRLKERSNIAEMTNVDDEFLWTLKVVGDIVLVSGSCVVEYVDRIKAILRETLNMEDQMGHRLSCILARSVLTTLLRTVPVNYHDESDDKTFDKDPLRNWGRKVQPQEVHVKWHTPDAQTVALAQEFFEGFARGSALDLLDQYASSKTDIEDKKLRNYLYIVEALFTGVSSHCSFDFEQPVQIPDVDFNYPKMELPSIGVASQEITIDGKQVRPYVANILHRTVDRILAGGAGDETKSLKSILVIYRALVMQRGPSADEVLALATALGFVKKELDNRLGLKKSRFRLLFIEKARLQHEMRCVFQKAGRVTQNRAECFRYIVRLAVSRYKEVRQTAQSVFLSLVGLLNLAYRVALNDILSFLASSKDKTDDNDAQLKGCLYLLVGQKSLSYFLKHDWNTLRKVFPAVVEAQHSENPTVSKLFDIISESCETQFVTTGITFLPNQRANEVAVAIMGTMSHELAVKFNHALTLDTRKLEEKNNRNRQLYLDLLEDLVRLLSAPQTRLKNFLVGHVFLSYFVRKDVLPPISLVNFTLERILDSNDKTRRSSELMMVSVMRAIKPERKKIRIQPCRSVDGTPLSLPETVGVREDNLWICFNEATVPKTEEAYDSAVFLDKMWPGYYGWPKNGLEVDAPIRQQEEFRNNQTKSAQVAEIEACILHRLTNEDFVDSLMKFQSAEDFAHGEFDMEIFLMYRAWFRHFRDKITPFFLKHVRKWVQRSEEHEQRAATEILTAMVRGSKRWPYKLVSKLWQEIIPIIQTALNNITGETQADWVVFASNSIGYGDMRQTYPLLNCVLSSMSIADTGFQTTSKLAVVFAIFECSDWRRRDLHYKIPQLAEGRLMDSYRDHVAFLLAICFRHDLNLPNMESRVDQGPNPVEFFQKYHDACQVLLNENGALTTLGLLNMFKTIVKTIVSHVSSLASLRPQLLQFYPLLCRFENDPRDSDLAKDCISALTCFSQVFLSEEAIPKLLQEVRSVAIDSVAMPWRARVVALDNLQVCVFNNLLTIMENPQWVAEISELIQSRLLDEQIEVRQMAAITLTGFVQCAFTPLTEPVLNKFHQLAQTAMPQDKSSAEYTHGLIRRHAGVLGLSACIAAHPYDVPPVVPAILMSLGNHINDPPPISTTVRSVFSEFRRTHHDSWRENKEKFSEDQLALLTDLLVSPNYYAYNDFIYFCETSSSLIS